MTTGWGWLQRVGGWFGGTKTARTVRGHVDTVTAHGAVGWAVDTGQPGRRLTVEALQNGRRIATILADQPRPDLRAQGLGDGGNGFQLDFPPGLVDAGAHGITVRLVENDEILFPRPKRTTVPQKHIAGLFEALDDGLVATGWAAVPGQPSSRCHIEVQVDGRPVAEGVADRFRSDLLAAGRGDGYHAFCVPLPPGALTETGQDVTVLADGHILPRAQAGGPDLSRLLRPSLGPARDGHITVQLPHGAPTITATALRINDTLQPMPDWPAGAGKMQWELPRDMQDMRTRLCQAVLTAGELTLVSEPRLIRVPDYTLEILAATPEHFCAHLTRNDASRPPQAVVYAGDTPQGCGRPAPGAGPDAPCQIDITFVPPRPDAVLTVRDAAMDVTVATVQLRSRHEALLALSQAVAVQQGAAGQALVRTLLGEALAGPDADSLTVLRPTPPIAAEQAGEVAVIVPVYGGPETTDACLRSVLATRNTTPWRLYVIDDASPDPAMTLVLDSLSGHDDVSITLLRLPVNLGFPGVANLGLVLAEGRDALLLNADTLVTDGWIDRLRAAALSRPMVGTVTPLSNNGEIATVPTICDPRPITDPQLVRELADTVARVNPGATADIPVGVGFCLYIRRECLDAVGLFEADTFGKGYGEETDFCLKAAALGFHNLLAGDCFVAHVGEVSFGPQKCVRLAESAQILAARYPFYDAAVRRFIRHDPAKILRQTVGLTLLADALPPGRVLHIIHGYAGGTERYMRDIAALDREHDLIPLVLRHEDDGTASLSVEVPPGRWTGFFRAPHVERYAAGASEALRQAIDLFHPTAVHLHAPFGAERGLLDWLAEHYPCDITVHDYAWLCPRVTLTDGQDRYCHEPSPEGCLACLEAFGPHPGLARHLAAAGGEVTVYREGFRRLFACARMVYAGSRDVAERLARYGFQTPVTVRPHPGTPDTVPVVRPGKPAADGVVRIALFGGLSGVKGAGELVDCAREAETAGLPLRFILFGYPAAREDLAGLANVTITGRYHEQDLDALVAANHPDLAFFPARWPETFSYTLSHAFRLGLWPVVSDLGAPAERVRQCGVGTVYSLSATPQELCALLLSEAKRRIGRALSMPEETT